MKSLQRFVEWISASNEMLRAGIVHERLISINDRLVTLNHFRMLF